MIITPLFTFLIIYCVILIVLAVFFTVNFFHIILTGTTTFTSFLVTFFVMASVMLVLFGTWYFLQGIDWLQPITVWDKSWFIQSSNIF